MKAQKISKTDRLRKAEREVLELKAQLASTYHFADASLDKASEDRMLGSGVLLQLTGIGGKELILPTMIRDGLSKETIECIRKDIARSYKTATEFKPKGC